MELPELPNTLIAWCGQSESIPSCLPPQEALIANPGIPRVAKTSLLPSLLQVQHQRGRESNPHHGEVGEPQ